MDAWDRSLFAMDPSELLAEEAVRAMMRVLEEAAISAVQQWRYQAALQNGKPVEVYFTIVVDFSLH